MAATDKEPTQAPDVPMPESPEEWETVGGGLGDEWDFERDGPLVGHFLGARVVETTKVESGEATAYQFAPRSAPDAVVFVWGSFEIAQAFDRRFDDGTTLIREGDLVRITYLGERSFTAADGKPRRVKSYRVQLPKAAS